MPEKNIMMFGIKLPGEFRKILLINALVVVCLRLTEILLISINFGSDMHALSAEGVGIVYDLLATSFLLLLISPVYRYIYQRKGLQTANFTFLVLIALLSFLHLLILNYFLYQLELLDVFLYRYSRHELLFTINTAESNYLRLIIPLGVVVLLIYLSSRYLQIRKNILSQYRYITFFVLLLLLIFFEISGFHQINKFSVNKSLFFYSRSFKLLFRKMDTGENYQLSDAEKFHALSPRPEYSSNEYPLLHKSDSLNRGGKYFMEFDQPPGIVILIVEGLNDDYLHDYNGVKLMPHLQKLRQKSLYWSRCFTLGERSFAAVPSITGGLPYGKKGFTLLDKLPLHMSLMKVLGANDYYTSFFYGQGAWFHQKDRFFTFNDMDLIFDKSDFPPSCEKIITGENKFFWGYDDMTLFSQSLNVLDTLPSRPKLNIYFTGSSHAPFKIPENINYESKFDSLRNLPNQGNSAVFYNSHEKYIKALMFLDDAINDFIRAYSSRKDYENTIFVITGDHPMTEMPIKNSLKRYHVPLIIYSPKLKTSAQFDYPVSHLDIYESLLGILRPYLPHNPAFSTSLGSGLFRTGGNEKRYFVFMDDNRDLNDLYYDGWYLSSEQLYRAGNDLSIRPSADLGMKKKLNEILDVFKRTNNYVCLKDKIIPEDIFCSMLNEKIYLSLQTDTAVHFDKEYYVIIPEVKVSGDREIILDLSFLPETQSKDMYLVYQLKDKNDSILYWKNTGMPEKSDYLQLHVKIPALPECDTLKFESFLWNKDKLSMGFSDLRAFVHSPDTIK